MSVKVNYVVGKPNVLDRNAFIECVKEILDSGIHTNDGPFVRALESFISRMITTKYCLAVSNATIGLELVLQALSLSGEVIVPSFTFTATVHAIVRSGLKPVFCEVDARGQIDCNHLESLITKNTCCLLPVNLYGYTCNLDRLARIANQNNLPLIYDSAHALGVRYKNQYIGSFGSAEVFSLHSTKFISGFEGGLIVTNSDMIAEAVKLLRNFGFVDYDKIDCLGTNGKLSEIHAAMALTNLKRMDELIEHNNTIYQTYKAAIASPLSLLGPLPEEYSNYQYVVVLCPEKNREYILSKLWHEGVLARRYFYPGVHKMKPYERLHSSLPATEQLANSVICLPTGLSVTISDAQKISKILNNAANSFGLAPVGA